MDYRDCLKKEIERRCTKNAAYSLRAFARDLRLSPSHLSGILGGRSGLSRKSALDISRKIGLNVDETEFFVESVESQHGRSRYAQQKALKKLRSLRRTRIETRTLELDVFQLITDWYPFAILELTYLKNFQPSISWIAQILKIPHLQAKVSLDRLFRLGLLKKKDESWFPSEQTTLTGFDIPSQAIKNFHAQILKKATLAIQSQSVDQRDFRATILAIRRDRLPEAKKAIEKLHRKFGSVISEGSTPNKEEVYCLSTQFFRLTEGPPS